MRRLPVNLILGGVLVAFVVGIAALSLLGFVLQVLPSLNQVNGEIIGLVLPVHAGLAAGVVRIRKARGEG